MEKKKKICIATNLQFYLLDLLYLLCQRGQCFPVEVKKKKKKKKEKKTSKFHCPYFRKVLENVLHDSKIVHVDIIPVFITKSYGVSRNHSNFDLTKFCI